MVRRSRRRSFIELQDKIPNTTRANDGINITLLLKKHKEINDEVLLEKEKNFLTKSLKSNEETLTK